MKKFDRALQWSKEKMGNDKKTIVSDEFKSMESEMQLRHEGMEKLHHSGSIYIKSLSKRREGDDKEKMIPVDILGQTMVTHGEEFEEDSQFGQCLSAMGRANESIARVQEAYVESVNDNWIVSLERSLTQMKEYQNARKRLETRRLAYDTTLGKIQKQKKEDFRVEEELRSQRIKYEESSDDVQRRMGEIRDAERETLDDMGAFLDAELEYYDKCRNILMKVRDRWPANIPTHKESVNKNRIRTNTAHSFSSNGRDRDSYNEKTPSPDRPERPAIRSKGISSASTSYSEYDNTPVRLALPNDNRPAFQRVNSTNSYNTNGDINAPRMIRSGTEPLPPPNLRPASRHRNADVFGDDHSSTSPEKLYADQPTYVSAKMPLRKISGVSLSQPASASDLSSVYSNSPASKKPPPPPVSRAKKPPPPPPPMKRTGLST